MSLTLQYVSVALAGIEAAMATVAFLARGLGKMMWRVGTDLIQYANASSLMHVRVSLASVQAH